MKRVSTLILSCQLGVCFAANTIIAIVNEEVITLQSIEQELSNVNSLKEKIGIIDQQIDISLQLNMALELGINPSQSDIKRAIIQVAEYNNITFEQLESYPEFPLLIQQITNKLLLLSLKQFITKDLNIKLSNDEINNNCINNSSVKNTKQIRISQIIISQVENSDMNSENQEKSVKNFLNKLSDHIKKGASFEAFAKLHSQHSSYANGGLTDWIFINNSTIEMLDLLQDGEVSKIYGTDSGWAIAIKIDERYIDTNLENCKEKIIFQKAQQFYTSWLKDLRDSAYIKIFTDKL